MRGKRSRGVCAGALAALAFGAAGCGGSEGPIKIGVLTDCQGPFRAFEDAQLSGAELPFVVRGGGLAGTGPASGVKPITVAGREVELVRGCSEAGEHTVYIEEARRLVETEHVDALVGGASVVARDVARRYPEVPFVAVFYADQEVTLRNPAPNLYRFAPDYAQQAAGLGAYAYRTLGWRRAAIVGGDGAPGWDGAAAFTAEFCALGGKVVREVYFSPFFVDPKLTTRALAVKPDGVATFLSALDQPAKILGELVGKLGDPAQQLLLWAPTMEDGTTMPALRSKLQGVVTTSWLSAEPPSRTLSTYLARHRQAFPTIPAGFGGASWVIGYYDAFEALLVAREQADGDISDGRRRLREELATLRIELPGGAVRLDSSRQAVRDMSLSRIGGPWLQPVKTIRAVEQTFGGLLSSAPPPGRGTQPCRRATPPAWAR